MNRSFGIRIRLLIFFLFALFAVVKYCSSADQNPTTGERQYVSMSPDEEIQLGLQSVPQMEAQYGGLSQDAEARQLVSFIGNNIIQHSEAKNSPYQFNFYLLADPQTVNAFALPGGQVFLTMGLLSRLENKDQLAGVLAHEIGHVVSRHSSEQIAKQELTGGLTGAMVMASGDYNSAQMAQMVNNLVNLRFSRQDELEADDLGVKYMIEAGYDPKQLIGVMKILEQAVGNQQVPEFESTHPYPENRIEKINQAIEKYKNVGTF